MFVLAILRRAEQMRKQGDVDADRVLVQRLKRLKGN